MHVLVITLRHPLEMQGDAGVFESLPENLSQEGLVVTNCKALKIPLRAFHSVKNLWYRLSGKTNQTWYFLFPVVTISDASFTELKENHGDFSNLCLETWRDGARLEQAAFTHVNALCYPSEKTIEAALEHYSIQKAKLHLLPMNESPDQQAKQLASLFKRLSN